MPPKVVRSQRALLRRQNYTFLEKPWAMVGNAARDSWAKWQRRQRRICNLKVQLTSSGFESLSLRFADAPGSLFKWFDLSLAVLRAPTSSMVTRNEARVSCTAGFFVGLKRRRFTVAENVATPPQNGSLQCTNRAVAPLLGMVCMVL